MTLPAPRLDDRTFELLSDDAKRFIALRCPEWTDLSVHDPGTVLVEAFAYLTEALLYRLNRLPEKAYVEFLRLLGVALEAPTAARASLTFTIDAPAREELVVPAGTRVAAARGGPPGAAIVFATVSKATIPAGARETSALALHCEHVEGELVAVGTGLPGQSYAVQRPPIIAPSGDALDLVVGVELRADELGPGVVARRFGEKQFRIWLERGRAPGAEDDPCVYVADRLTGTLSFAPAIGLVDDRRRAGLPAFEVPGEGREIRAWYRRGGGPEGNVAAGELTSLKDLVAGAQVRVRNAGPAVGGRAAESVASALQRGPEELRDLRRAVTAGDFETLARRIGGVARARAVTQVELWEHGRPGTVEVVLVPELPPEVRGEDDAGVTAEALRARHAEGIRVRIQDDLDARRPIGTRCQVSWARYKTVVIKATVRAYRVADPEAVKAAVLSRLHRYVSPLPSPDGEGGAWPFGGELPRYTVSHIIHSVPGVSGVDSVRFVVDEVPASTAALAADSFQRRTWYAGGEGALYRTMSDAESWEQVGRFDGQQVTVVAAHGTRAGLVAAAAHVLPDMAKSLVHVSPDCGETWARPQEFTAVSDLAWTERDGKPLLLVATAEGLYELPASHEAPALQVAVAPGAPKLGLAAVACAQDARGNWIAAVAARDRKGVFLSGRGGATGTFVVQPDLQHQDVRRLEVQDDGVRTRIWAGLFTPSAEDKGNGCFFLETTGAGAWTPVSQGWEGGSCLALAFDGPTVYAATNHRGVLTLDASTSPLVWQKPPLGCGLPQRAGQQKPFEPVVAVAARRGIVLTGGAMGVFRRDPDEIYRHRSGREIEPEKLPIPSTSVLCSGRHDIHVEQG